MKIWVCVNHDRTACGARAVLFVCLKPDLARSDHDGIHDDLRARRINSGALKEGGSFAKKFRLCAKHTSRSNYKR